MEAVLLTLYLSCYATITAAHSIPHGVLSKVLERSFPQQQGSEHRKLQSAYPTVVNPVCNSDSDISLGPSQLLSDLTDPSVYDLKKRPSISYHKSRYISPYPDNVWNYLVVNDIVKLDELTQSLTTSFYDVFTWNDARLKFNTSTNGACVVPGLAVGTPTLDLEIHQFYGADKVIWTPSTFISNVQFEYTGIGFAFINADGYITTLIQKEIRTACDMHFGMYPFDSHTCSIDVSTLGQSPYDVTLIPGSITFDRADEGGDFIDKLEKHYQVGEFIAKRSYTGTSFAIFPGLSANIVFERNAKYFTTSILLPDILLHISVYTGFWIDSTNAQARVGLCIISGLSFRYLMNAISIKLPAVTYNIWVVDYMLASQFLAVLALVQYGAVQYFLSIEHVRLKLLDGFKKSKISDMLRRRVVKPSTIFEQAELKHKEFLASSKEAQTAKGEPVAKQDTTASFTGVFKFKAHRRQKKNKVGIGSMAKNMLLEMIKIAEAETEEEEEQDEGESTVTHQLPVMSALPSVNKVEDNNHIITMSNSDSDDMESDGESISDAKRDSVGLGESKDYGDKLKGKFVQFSGAGSNRSITNNSTSRRSSYRSDVSDSTNSGSSRQLSRCLQLLTTFEVLTIAYVKEAFEKFDTDHNGVLTIQELKLCFRAFGKYYTTNQVCALLEAFRTSQGHSLAKRPTLHFVDFFCLLVELEQHEPLPEFKTRDFLAIPPSLILDMFMRICFPFFVGLKIWIFFVILDDYKKP